MKPRLFLADDEASIRQSLAFVLKRTCNCEVVGEAGDGEDALRQCENLRPAVLVVDLRMPVMNGSSLVREVRRRKLGVALLVYTAAMDPDSLLEAMVAAPEGFVLKSDELPVLRRGIQAVCAGTSFWSPKAGELRNKQMEGRRRLSVLSDSEREVLRLVAVGKSTKEIAGILHKAVDTVKHQRQSIMDKLGVHNAVALASLAREAGIGG
jgi:DNA-binding NarL/FixJ family response regulator